MVFFEDCVYSDARALDTLTASTSLWVSGISKDVTNNRVGSLSHQLGLSSVSQRVLFSVFQ